jgi:3-oxoacyl-[acyl-carrier-protein] synthase-3
MFGDAGTASLITRDEKYADSFFSLNTDGSQLSAVNIPGGGFRHMSSVDTLTYKKDEHGNEKNDEQIHMDGMEVFSYSVSAICKDVKKILAFSGLRLIDVDTFVFHQANKYMNDLISKKLHMGGAKTVESIHKYGNTSCASIPLTIAENREALGVNDKLLFTAIGAGFTWGSAIVKLSNLKNLGVIEV